jgi:hypothetical protein
MFLVNLFAILGIINKDAKDRCENKKTKTIIDSPKRVGSRPFRINYANLKLCRYPPTSCPWPARQAPGTRDVPRERHVHHDPRNREQSSTLPSKHERMHQAKHLSGACPIPPSRPPSPCDGPRTPATRFVAAGVFQRHVQTTKSHGHYVRGFPPLWRPSHASHSRPASPRPLSPNVTKTCSWPF